jgi:hypothetical protein
MHSLLNKAVTARFIALSLSLVGIAPAAATVVTYTSVAAFNAAITPIFAYNFTGFAPLTGYVPGPTNIDGFLFSGPNAGAFGENYDDGGLGPQAHYGTGYFSSSTVGVGPLSKIKVDLGINGFSAVGFYYGSFNTANSPVIVDLNTGDSFNLLNTPLNAGYETRFIGFTSSSSNLKVFDFRSEAQNLDIPQFKVSSALPTEGKVPLPSSLLLLLSGLGVCVRPFACKAWGRRRQSGPSKY